MYSPLRTQWVGYYISDVMNALVLYAIFYFLYGAEDFDEKGLFREETKDS